MFLMPIEIFCDVQGAKVEICILSYSELDDE